MGSVGQSAMHRKTVLSAVRRTEERKKKGSFDPPREKLLRSKSMDRWEK
jgi:hypothetical protein